MPSGAGSRGRSTLLPLVAIAAVAGLAWFAFGRGFVNFDAMWALVWGSQIAHLHAPTYAALAAPTPHPLQTLVGVVFAPLGSRAEPALLAVGYLSVGALVYATGLLAYRMFGMVAGVLAAALMFTRDTLSFYGALAYLDVTFAALVVWAMALEAQRPRRGTPVLVLLAAAGLLRPEAWLLSALYFAWLWPGLEKRAKVRLAALTALAPVLWAACDLAVTGDPAFSFTFTRHAAVALHRITGLHGLIHDGPRLLGQQLRPAGLAAAIVGSTLCIFSPGRRPLLAWSVATGVAVCIPVLAGTPLHARYLLPTIALACVAGAAALTGWSRETGGRRVAWGLAAAGVAVAVLVTAPAQRQRLAETRRAVVDQRDDRLAARQALDAALPCLPLTVQTPFLTPLVRIWKGVPLAQIHVGTGRRGAAGTYLLGTAPALTFAGFNPDARIDDTPVRGAIVLHESPRGWTLDSRCPAATDAARSVLRPRNATWRTARSARSSPDQTPPGST